MSDAGDILSTLKGDMSASLDRATKPKASGVGVYLADVNAAASKQREGAQKQIADTKAESARYDKEVSALGPPPALHAEKWTQAPPENDPLKSFGSWASAVGVLGSLLTRRPLSSALNASAAAMNAQRSNDLAAYKEAHAAWKENTELAMKQSEYELKVYDDIYKRAGLSHNEKMAEISAAAAANKDEAMSYMLQAKGIEGAQSLQESRQNMQLKSAEIKNAVSDLAEKTEQRMETNAAVQQYVEGKAREWMAAHPDAKPNPNDPQVKQQLLAWAKEGRRLEESKDANWTYLDNRVGQENARRSAAGQPPMSPVDEGNFRNVISGKPSAGTGKPLTEQQRITDSRALAADESHIKAVDNLVDRISADRTGIATKYARLPFSSALAQLDLGDGEIAKMSNDLKLLQSTLKTGRLKAEWETRAEVFDIGSPTAAVLEALRQVRNPLVADANVLRQGLWGAENAPGNPGREDPLGIR